MIQDCHTSSGEAATGLILEVFKLNGRLLAEGDKLVAGLGLTSARWQVLGVIALAARAEPVAHLARNMGLTRQGVQRIVDEFVREGFARFDENPHHRRAKLVALTDRGRETYEGAARLQIPWANAVAEGLGAAEIRDAASMLKILRERLE